MLLENRVAIVTGAGRGIGFGIAERMAQEGAQVVIGELVEERGREAAAKLTAAGYKADVIQLDVTKSASCQALVDQVMRTYGQVDILVNNAGMFILHKSEEMPEEDWCVQIDVLLTGVFLMTQAVARAAMIPQRRGSVVNIASIGGMGGWPMRSPYNAAKAAVIVLTECLATEWAQYHIRLNCVSPGVTRTEMTDLAVQQGAASNLSKFERRAPLGRMGEVADIANAVAFLASDRASFITGENLVVDGGWVPWANPAGVGFPE